MPSFCGDQSGLSAGTPSARLGSSMLCTTCSEEITDAAKFCGQCGRLVVRSEPLVDLTRECGVTIPQLARQPIAAWSLDSRIVLAIGFVTGGFIGFLLRPSVFLVGQLPFGTVVTRGSGLSGLDQLLVPSAQQSFNFMVAGALVGAAGAFAASRFMAKSAV